MRFCPAKINYFRYVWFWFTAIQPIAISLYTSRMVSVAKPNKHFCLFSNFKYFIYENIINVYQTMAPVAFKCDDNLKQDLGTTFPIHGVYVCVCALSTECKERAEERTCLAVNTIWIRLWSYLCVGKAFMGQSVHPILRF